MEIEPQVKQEVETQVEVKANVVAETKKQKIIVEPRLKPVPYKNLDLQTNSTINKTPIRQINDKQFYNNEDNPLNKRGYKYKPCKPNPHLKLILYSTTDLPPYTVRPSYFDKSAGIIFDEELKTISNTIGWRSIRSNIGIKEGKWYFEFNIIRSNDESKSGNVRLGVARREASLDAPIGYDGYGYSIRDVNGQKVTLSRPKDFMESGFKTGDTIGILIELPSLKDQYKAVENELKSEKPLHADSNIIRDQIPIKYKNSLYFEQFEYTPIEDMTKLLNPIQLIGEKLSSLNETIDLPKISGSRIVVYKNGELVDTMFEDLYSFLPIPGNLSQNQNQNFRNCDDGSLGYYPMISIYNQAIVEFNAGPDFVLQKLPEGVKPLSTRYYEHIVEQWYFDLIDEVESEYLDNLETQQ